MPPRRPSDRIAAVDDDSALEFVVELWRRGGWTVDPVDGHAYVAVAARTSNGERTRTVLRVFPSSDGAVSGDAMRGLVASLQPANRVTAVSLVGFTSAALDVADAHGVDVVGPDSVRRLVDAHDADDLLETGR